ncbi:hypothetical protein EGW08_016920 [Elysia chlorotica]|uniref:E2F-associated phosphoprotein n=1 Tax=Elysia chlorotica TaxID=188477 RepID=A0A3S0ZI17_ELYCH|nr:hypothetical protein EGW08_016920 [Elysia chlorotica]
MSGSLYAKENGYDMFGEDDSSDNGQSSSEDEIDIILHGTPEQKRKLHHLHKKWLTKKKNDGDMGASSSSSEDDFEKEMEAELNMQVEFMEKTRDHLAIQGISIDATSSSDQHAEASKDESKDKKEKAAEEFYDEIYFDSDEEEDASTRQNAGKNSKHRIISNDDLLYDPDMDDRDQKWVDKQRLKHGSKAGGKRGKKPNSDALLDCPACMTTLCIDCQRHEIHKNQYRAMFVMNCTVDASETLECPEQPNKKKKGKKKSQQQATDTGSTSTTSTSKDLFNPVRCSECGTVVGVYDTDEVYHFFNVLASHT